MEKYPPSISRRDRASRATRDSFSGQSTRTAKTTAQNSKLREKAERSAAKKQSQLEADRRKAESDRHEAVARLTVVWREDILPRWSVMEHSTKVRKLVAQGIPTSLRGTVWPLLIGNRLGVTEALYEQSKKEAFRIKQLSLDREAALEAAREKTVRFAADMGTGGTTAAVSEPEEMTADLFCATDGRCDGADAGEEQLTAAAVSITEVSVTVERDPLRDDPPSEDAVDSGDDQCYDESLDVDGNRMDAVQADDLKIDTSVDLLRLSVSERRLSSRVQTVNLIQWDIPRTFPTLSFFHNGGPLSQSLENVLMAYAAYRPDVGYVQGMSFLVAVLLLQMEEYSAFQCLVNLMKRRNQLDFYRLNLEAVTSFSEIFNHYFYKYLPLLYRHFNEQGMSHTMFLVDWNLTLFSKALPLECAIRIWDSYLVEGEVFVMRAALGLLRLHAPKLSQMTMESIAPFLMRLPENTTAADVFANIAEIRISHSNYNSICEKYKFNRQEWLFGTVQKLHKIFSPHASDDGTSSPQERPSKREAIREFVSSLLTTKSS